ncbi:MAG: tetratricopeptide repeat protein [Planctomycetaceae bacterium]
MRPGLLLFLGMAACRSPEAPPSSMVRDRIYQARVAERIPDWAKTRAYLEEAHLWSPGEPEVSLRLGHLLLSAYAEIPRARELFANSLRRSRARALHGLGLCSLAEGNQERALELLSDSMKAAPSAPCARDRALLLLSLGRSGEAQAALDEVERISRASVESELLMAAAGRLPAPPAAPPEWSYALARARLAAALGSDDRARAELLEHFSKAYASPQAMGVAGRILRQDFVFRRNPALVETINSLSQEIP